MRRKELEQRLDAVEDFEKPKVKYEQYPTPSHIASQIIFTIESSFSDFNGKNVMDLGCGCGMLGIGANLMGATYVLGVDIDQDAIDIAKQNVKDVVDDEDEEEEEESNEKGEESSTNNKIEFVLADVCELYKNEEDGRWKDKFQIVIMNPPFGTKKNKGIDMIFLEMAVKIATETVYSLHKTSTRDFIQKKCKQLGVEGRVIAELRYDIPAMYNFHKKSSVDINVDFWRFTKKKT